ncbi:MAG: zf-HC2 domain-containing protein [Cyclobacteriaceae bacterium]|jgi:anti-sigma factor (TIGR02949 family)|nr:zf-HC2 domain-containing protein [Cyclobacteriaceae bacterium]
MNDLSDSSSSCQNLSCLEMLQLMIDGDPTPEQRAHFESHIMECMPCYESYNLDMAVRLLLKSKCTGNGAPPQLIEKIKMQISQNLPH